MSEEIPSPIHIVVTAGDQHLIDRLLLIAEQNDLPIVLHQYHPDQPDRVERINSFAERLRRHQVLIIGSGHPGLGISAHYAYQEAQEQILMMQRPLGDISFDPAILEEVALSVKSARVSFDGIIAEIKPYFSPEKSSRRSGKKGKGFPGARNRVICNDAYTQPRHR